MAIPTLHGRWSTVDEALDDFRDGYDYPRTKDNAPLPNEDRIEVLFGAYWGGSYDGSAFVLWRDRETGKLYTVEGGHCSCNGLEGQWSPVETTVPALRLMLGKGALGACQYDEDGNWAVHLDRLLTELVGTIP